MNCDYLWLCWFVECVWLVGDLYVCNFVCGSDGGFYVIDLVVVLWLVDVGNLFIEDWFGCV